MGRRGRGEALDQSHCREWVSMGPHDTSQLGFLLIFNPRAESLHQAKHNVAHEGTVGCSLQHNPTDQGPRWQQPGTGRTIKVFPTESRSPARFWLFWLSLTPSSCDFFADCFVL